MEHVTGLKQLRHINLPRINVVATFNFNHQNFLEVLHCKMAHGNYNPVIDYNTSKTNIFNRECHHRPENE